MYSYRPFQPTGNIEEHNIESKRTSLLSVDGSSLEQAKGTKIFGFKHLNPYMVGPVRRVYVAPSVCDPPARSPESLIFLLESDLELQHRGLRHDLHLDWKGTYRFHSLSTLRFPCGNIGKRWLLRHKRVCQCLGGCTCRKSCGYLGKFRFEDLDDVPFVWITTV